MKLPALIITLVVLFFNPNQARAQSRPSATPAQTIAVASDVTLCRANGRGEICTPRSAVLDEAIRSEATGLVTHWRQTQANPTTIGVTVAFTRHVRSVSVAVAVKFGGSRSVTYTGRSFTNPIVALRTALNLPEETTNPATDGAFGFGMGSGGSGFGTGGNGFGTVGMGSVGTFGMGSGGSGYSLPTSNGFGTGPGDIDPLGRLPQGTPEPPEQPCTGRYRAQPPLHNPADP